MNKYHKYSTNTKGGQVYNADRTVEAWWDDNYKKYYYRANGDLNKRNYGDISAILEMKKRLKCHNFTWYIENVFPDIWIPDKLKDEYWLTTTTTEDKTTTTESSVKEHEDKVLN